MNLKKSLKGVIIQFEQATIPSMNATTHATTLQQLHSFNFFASVYFLVDVLRPVHIMHAQLQKIGLILKEVQGYYITARGKLQRFLDDGCSSNTTPNLLQFVEEVRVGKVTEEMIPKLKPAQDTPANRSERLGDLLRVFLADVA